MPEPTPDRPRTYYEAVTAEDQKLAAIRADEAAGELTTCEAAGNRIAALEAHLQNCRLLAARYASATRKTTPDLRAHRPPAVGCCDHRLRRADGHHRPAGCLHVAPGRAGRDRARALCRTARPVAMAAAATCVLSRISCHAAAATIAPNKHPAGTCTSRCHDK
jgi:hypothetical protein